MFVLLRAVVYSTAFIATLLVFLPSQLLGPAGLTRPPNAGPMAIVGIATTLLGGLLALWCIGTFVVLGRGTPAPFDPPRRLVLRGPYRFVRNPMYLGAGLVLVGAILVYRSGPLLGYLAVLAVATHSLVVMYEEPTLRRQFGDAYGDYCKRVPRWLPRLFQAQRDATA